LLVIAAIFTVGFLLHAGAFLHHMVRM